MERRERVKEEKRAFPNEGPSIGKGAKMCMCCLEKHERLCGSWLRLGWSGVGIGWGALMSLKS